MATLLTIEVVSKDAVTSEKPRKTVSAYRILALILILRPFGNLSLAWGTKHFSQVLAINPLVYLQAMLNPYVAAGIATLILATLMRIALLSLADLSYVVPLTATGYIISTLLGKFFLQEQISVARWVGIALIFAGTVVVSSTSSKTLRKLSRDSDSHRLKLVQGS